MLAHRIQRWTDIAPALAQCFVFSKIHSLNTDRPNIFIHLKLCLATATHNFKWIKITTQTQTVSKVLSANLDYSFVICFISRLSLQAANCCRNSRLVVDEDDLK